MANSEQVKAVPLYRTERDSISIEFDATLEDREMGGLRSYGS
jgi:hypothetical protein